MDSHPIPESDKWEVSPELEYEHQEKNAYSAKYNNISNNQGNYRLQIEKSIEHPIQSKIHHVNNPMQPPYYRNEHHYNLNYIEMNNPNSGHQNYQNLPQGYPQVNQYLRAPNRIPPPPLSGPEKIKIPPYKGGQKGPSSPEKYEDMPQSHFLKNSEDIPNQRGNNRAQEQIPDRPPVRACLQNQRRRSPPPRNRFPDMAVMSQEDKDLKFKADSFAVIFPSINPMEIRKVISQSKGLTEDEMYLKLYEISQTVQPERKNFDLKNYKTTLCPSELECNDPFCIYYHYLGEMRRKTDFYNKMCENVINCEEREKCYYAHNSNEIIYHDSMVGRFPCPIKPCPWGSVCIFVHSQEESGKSIAESLTEVLKVTENNKKQIALNKDAIDKAIEEKKEEKKNIEKRIICSVCHKYRIEFVGALCGHCSCSLCSLLDRCPVCKIRSPIISIAYPNKT